MNTMYVRIIHDYERDGCVSTGMRTVEVSKTDLDPP